jgi:hypothetical protein
MRNKATFGVEAPGTWLTPIRLLPNTDPYSATWYLFRCRCGKEKRIRYGAVYNTKGKHRTKSCGCLLRKITKEHPDIGFKPGNIPWHKGKQVGAERLGRNGGGWNKGKIRIDHPDGTWEWIDVHAQLPPDTGGQTLPGERQR